MVEHIGVRGLTITDFPFTIKNAKKFSGMLGFINLKTQAENDDIIVLGRENPDQEAYLYLMEDADLNGVRLKNLNPAAKINSQGYEELQRPWIHF